MPRSPRQLLPILAVFAVGIVLGRIGVESTAHADVRRTPERESFKSGSARSESLLREIAGTLKKIDGRVARIESKLANAK